jgi:putative two-component system response regulator
MPDRLVLVARPPEPLPDPARRHVLVVDDSETNLKLLSAVLGKRGCTVRTAADGAEALRAVEEEAPDLILLDVVMPGDDGFEVCRRLKADARFAKIPVLFLSALDEVADKVRGFAAGGVDYVTKPFQPEEVVARVETQLELGALQRELALHARQLEDRVARQVKEISSLQMATIFALAKLADARDEGTGRHLERVQTYSRVLAERLRVTARLDGLVDAVFVDAIIQASPLHDIGKVAIPDAILLATGPLSPAQMEVMKTHPTIGARTLEAVRGISPKNTFINMGIAVARSHHERWDGDGYPDGLAAADIPLSARIVSLVDCYDALTSVRPYKRAMSHGEAVAHVDAASGKAFDPRVVAAFHEVGEELDALRGQLADAA